MKLLVVDDSNTTRFVLIKMLKELGYQDITGVSTAEEAIPLVFNENFDCVLLDWNLPKMSGLDFLKYVRSQNNLTSLPIVMVTTVNEKSNVITALKTGLQGYLFKPVQREALAAKLAEIGSRKTE